MQEDYNNVPNIITGKDLDYLTDIFDWNYNALKSINDSIENITNNEIRELMTECLNLYDNNLLTIIKILGGNNE